MVVGPDPNHFVGPLWAHIEGGWECGLVGLGLVGFDVVSINCESFYQLHQYGKDYGFEDLEKLGILI